MNTKAYKAALQWYIDNGVNESLEKEPVNRLNPAILDTADLRMTATSADRKPDFPPAPSAAAAPLGTAEAKINAIRLASAATSLEELSASVASFDGLAIRKTATNTVFSDGNPQSPIMLVGEAPGADEDRMGKPFVGVSGQLLDRILACIGLDRTNDDPAHAVYISNILNWRPPGNRTPSPAEIDVSLAFIEKHIMLVKPKILILCGGVSAKALLGREDSISKLRRSWSTYRTRTEGLGGEPLEIPCLATYHPAYLLRTPSQKAAVWEDMLKINKKRRELGLAP